MARQPVYLRYPARARTLSHAPHVRDVAPCLSLSLSLCLSTPLEAEKATRFTRKVIAARCPQVVRRRISQSRDFKGDLVILGYQKS